MPKDLRKMLERLVAAGKGDGLPVSDWREWKALSSDDRSKAGKQIREAYEASGLRGKTVDAGAMQQAAYRSRQRREPVAQVSRGWDRW